MESKDKIKSDAYNEGYSDATIEWVKMTFSQRERDLEAEIKHNLEILDKISELRKSWFDAGYAKAKKELEKHG